MNKVLLVGRLTKEPSVRYTSGSQATAVAKFTLAVERKIKVKDQPTADFLNCVAFGKSAEALEKYVKKGMKVGIEGHIQTGSYTDKEGKKVYTTDVVVEAWEFCESKSGTQNESTGPSPAAAAEQMSFMDVTSTDMDDLPFN